MAEPTPEAPERCPLCPHPADRIQTPPLPTNAPLTMFPCGHAVHTQCALTHLYYNHYGILNMLCLTCNQPVLSQEVMTYLRDNREAARDPDRNTVKDLWENNEVFREQVKEAAKLERDALKKRAVVKKGVDAIKREWKKETAGYQTILKNMRETYIRRFREIKGKREASLATGKAQRAKRLIRDTFDLGYWELEGLSRIRGAPKLGGMTRRWRRWFMSPRYIFRFYI